ncbi:MAG TPA: FAD-dependent oxidoreductase [Nocardioides sp.]|nr:FAD-dependent oxidoreductase [Nocardioides sp.]
MRLDTVVIGAGVIGSAIALELARAGHEVVVLDKGTGVGFGSTSASSAIVRFHYSTFTAVAAAWEARQLWADWAGHLGHPDPDGLATFHRTGMLVLGDGTPPHLDEAGVPWEMWDPDEVGRRVPELDTGRYGPPVPVDDPAFFEDARGRLGGSYTPDAGYVDDPRLAAANLAAAARHHGASFLVRREVVGIDGDGPRRWRVRTATGDRLDADVVVNAAGPWSSRLAALLGADADFAFTSRPLRQEVHQLAASGPVVTVADPDLGVYLRPQGEGQLVVGGLEPACDPLHWLDRPEDADPRPTRAVFEAQTLRAARRVPGLAVPSRPQGITGVYDATPDWTPIYDRTALPGVYVAMGTSGNQFKNAPVVGQLMAHLIASVEAGHPHDAEPLTWRAPRTGNVLDLATFSRRRRVGSDGPSNVLG